MKQLITKLQKQLLTVYYITQYNNTTIIKQLKYLIIIQKQLLTVYYITQ